MIDFGSYAVGANFAEAEGGKYGKIIETTGELSEREAETQDRAASAYDDIAHRSRRIGVAAGDPIEVARRIQELFPDASVRAHKATAIGGDNVQMDAAVASLSPERRAVQDEARRAYEELGRRSRSWATKERYARTAAEATARAVKNPKLQQAALAAVAVGTAARSKDDKDKRNLILGAGTLALAVSPRAQTQDSYSHQQATGCEDVEIRSVVDALDPRAKSVQQGARRAYENLGRRSARIQKYENAVNAVGNTAGKVLRDPRAQAGLVLAASTATAGGGSGEAKDARGGNLASLHGRAGHRCRPGFSSHLTNTVKRYEIPFSFEYVRMADRHTQETLLAQLASTDPRKRRNGTTGLFKLFCEENDGMQTGGERLRRVLDSEWKKISDRGAHLVSGLMDTLLHDEGLMTIEMAAIALASQGEDGATTLLTSIDNRDFAIRSKVANGIGILRNQARWAVPTLLRLLRRERTSLVLHDILRALIRIGGGEAETGLALLLQEIQGDSPELRAYQSVIRDAHAQICGRSKER